MSLTNAPRPSEVNVGGGIPVAACGQAYHLELHVYESRSEQREDFFGLRQRERTRPGADADCS